HHEAPAREMLAVLVPRLVSRELRLTRLRLAHRGHERLLRINEWLKPVVAELQVAVRHHDPRSRTHPDALVRKPVVCEISRLVHRDRIAVPDALNLLQ